MQAYTFQDKLFSFDNIQKILTIIVQFRALGTFMRVHYLQSKLRL